MNKVTLRRFKPHGMGHATASVRVQRPGMVIPVALVWATVGTSSLLGGATMTAACSVRHGDGDEL